jgi:hypothetical protein
MKTRGGVDEQLRAFLNLALHGNGWFPSCPCPFTPVEPPVPIELGVGWAPKPLYLRRRREITSH